MMYLLDTNIISEMRKIAKGKANKGVVDFLSSISHSQIYTNVVILMELERGVLRIERKDPQQGKLLRNWFDKDIALAFGNNMLQIDKETARICAELHIPDLYPENDAWIAASAIQHKLTLVTRNERDFRNLGVNIINPFI